MHRYIYIYTYFEIKSFAIKISAHWIRTRNEMNERPNDRLIVTRFAVPSLYIVHDWNPFSTRFLFSFPYFSRFLHTATVVQRVQRARNRSHISRLQKEEIFYISRYRWKVKHWCDGISMNHRVCVYRVRYVNVAMIRVPQDKILNSCVQRICVTLLWLRYSYGCEFLCRQMPDSSGQKQAYLMRLYVMYFFLAYTKSITYFVENAIEFIGKWIQFCGP